MKPFRLFLVQFTFSTHSFVLISFLADSYISIEQLQLVVWRVHLIIFQSVVNKPGTHLTNSFLKSKYLCKILLIHSKEVPIAHKCYELLIFYPSSPHRGVFILQFMAQRPQKSFTRMFTIIQHYFCSLSHNKNQNTILNHPQLRWRLTIIFIKPVFCHCLGLKK